MYPARPMDIVPLAIPDLKLVRSKRSGDARGWFMEIYRRDRMADAGISDEFVQDNQSFSAARGTLRGLHLQRHAPCPGEADPGSERAHF